MRLDTDNSYFKRNPSYSQTPRFLFLQPQWSSPSKIKLVVSLLPFLHSQPTTTQKSIRLSLTPLLSSLKRSSGIKAWHDDTTTTQRQYATKLRSNTNNQHLSETSSCAHIESKEPILASIQVVFINIFQWKTFDYWLLLSTFRNLHRCSTKITNPNIDSTGDRAQIFTHMFFFSFVFFPLFFFLSKIIWNKKNCWNRRKLTLLNHQ